MAAMSAPGWYPDPDGGPQVRYFDGRQWTSQTAQPLAQSNQSGPASSGPTNQWLWVAIALVVAMIIGVASWLLFFRDSTATPPTPSVTEPLDPSTPDTEPSAEPSESEALSTDQPELPPQSSIIEPVQGCPGTASDAMGEPDPDGRFTSGAGLSMPAADGFVPASLQFPWVHESNTQGKQYDDDQLAFITVGTVRAEAGYVDTNATAIAMAACVLGSGVYDTMEVTGTVARSEQIPEQDQAQIVLGVDVLGADGRSAQILYVLALKDADVMHVLVGSVPDADLEAAEAMAAATKDLKLQ